MKEADGGLTCLFLKALYQGKYFPRYLWCYMMIKDDLTIKYRTKSI